MNLKYNLKLHHTGCITSNIEASIKTYCSLGFQNCSEIFAISSQQVKVCFIEIGNGVFLELVEPFENNDTMKKYLKSKTSFYHLGFLTEAFEETVKRMQTDGFYLINQFNSEAFSNKQCAFLYSSEMHLVEIIEQ